jgi:alpha-D-xyloside xylohydrolase
VEKIMSGRLNGSTFVLSAGVAIVAAACAGGGGASRSEAGADGAAAGSDGGVNGSFGDASGGDAGRDASAGDASEEDSSIALVCPPPPDGGAFSIDAFGVTFPLQGGVLRLEVCQADVIRVEYATASSIPAKTSLSVNASWPTPSFCVSETGDTVTISTARMQANVATATGLVSFGDLAGNVLLAEASKVLAPATVEGVATNTVQTAWSSPANEALFGLGQHQDGVINRKGSTLVLQQANTEIQIPLLVSNKGNGVLWDNPSITSFAGNAAATPSTALARRPAISWTTTTSTDPRSTA